MKRSWWTMLEVEWKGIEELARDLETFAEQAVPYAARAALNNAAFEAKRIWTEEAKSSMVLRNTFTARSILVTKATGTNVDTLESVVGSTQPYMQEQEDGVTHRSQGKHGVPIPTSVAAGQARGSVPRRRLVTRPNKLASITLRQRPGSTPKQRNAVAISQARKSGTRYAFLEFGERKGIFKVPVSTKGKLQQIWDLSERATIVPRNPMLGRTMQALEPKLPGLYEKALLAQLKRHRVLGY